MIPARDRPEILYIIVVFDMRNKVRVVPTSGNEKKKIYLCTYRVKSILYDINI